MGLDTFCGHSGARDEHDGIAHFDSMFKGDGFANISHYLKDLPNLRLIEGDVTLTLESALADIDSIRFAHVDMDIYGPTAYALPMLANLLVQGGIMLLDDYGFLTCPGAKKATDEFLAGRTDFIKFHHLTGQCVLIKI